jgi:hypothetical protein
MKLKQQMILNRTSKEASYLSLFNRNIVFTNTKIAIFYIFICIINYFIFTSRKELSFLPDKYENTGCNYSIDARKSPRNKIVSIQETQENLLLEKKLKKNKNDKIQISRGDNPTNGYFSGKITILC